MPDLFQNLINNPTPVIWLLLTIFVSLYLRELISKRSSHILEDAELKSTEIIQNALKKSQEIITQAETQSLRITGEAKLMDVSWKENLQKVMQDNQSQIFAQTNALFEKFESTLSQFLTQTQSQSTKAVELELQSARSLIENYKASQLRMVDENIVAILERTLSIILAKNLTLADQMDLVYKALEKAKAEKFFV